MFDKELFFCFLILHLILEDFFGTISIGTDSWLVGDEKFDFDLWEVILVGVYISLMRHWMYCVGKHQYVFMTLP
jgi:hypothetical protein